jgi:tetratricopeptide (TPR) repeat protein
MDHAQLLRHLRELSLEEGSTYLAQHDSELPDSAVFGNVLAEEALDQLYTNPAVSLKIAELLIRFGDYRQHLSSHALGLKAKGDTLRVLGLHQAAIDCLDAAAEEFLRMGDEANWARSRITWILSASWLGRVEDALSEASCAREVFLRLDEPYWACIVDHNTAYVYEQVGRYQNALALYERTLAIYPTLTEQSETAIQRAIAMAQVNQSLDLALLGNFEEAYAIQKRAQETFIELGEISMSVNAENNLADFDYTQGYYASALFRYHHARDVLAQHHIDDPLLLAELKLWMAKCLLKLNRADEACMLAEEAAQVHRQSGTSLQMSNALREYAATLIASGQTKNALTVLEEAATLFSKGGLVYYAAITRLQQAELLLSIGNFIEAYRQASLLKAYFEDQGLISRLVRTKLVIAEALVAYAQQQDISREQRRVLYYKAKMLCKQTSLQASRHHLQEEVYKIHALLGRIFVFQQEEHKALLHYSAAIAQIERMLDHLTYDLSPSFMHTAWTVYEDIIALCLQQSHPERAFNYLARARSTALRQYLNRASTLHLGQREMEPDYTGSRVRENSAAMLRTQQALNEWQERYRLYNSLRADKETFASLGLEQDVLLDELKQCETKLSELFERLHFYQSDISHTSQQGKRERRKSRNQPVNIENVQHALSPEQLLLAYFLYKEKLVIFALTATSLVTFERPDGRTELERLLPLLHAHLQPGGWPDIHHPPQQAIQRLLKKLYDLLIGPLASILPSLPGHLTIVPYGPLHKLPFHALYDGSRYLIEQCQVHYFPASYLLVYANERKREQKALSLSRPVTVQSPLVFGYSGNGHLQRTIDEATMIADLLHGRSYLEQDATIARLIEEAPGSPVIHIATHGMSKLDSPNLSYVLLADGQFSAFDAFSLNLRQCELVTLSGCETGLALSGGGDEQLGLGRAFLAAGAESLLMSLWPVEDNATNELMQIVYQRLLHGDTKMQALRAAQCHLLKRHSHPYFWAAFRLVGDSGPLVYCQNRQAQLVSSKADRENGVYSAFHE